MTGMIYSNQVDSDKLGVSDDMKNTAENWLEDCLQLSPKERENCPTVWDACKSRGINIPDQHPGMVRHLFLLQGNIS